MQKNRPTDDVRRQTFRPHDVRMASRETNSANYESIIERTLLSGSVRTLTFRLSICYERID